MQTQEEKKQKEKEVPKEVKSSQFGCPNCLWSCVECNNGSKYTPRTNTDNGCKSYAYYD